ncbi:ABC transporter permease subunit [Duganella sp. FT135W]|uniref:ABC transporter permease subunit n=1 Tax=Duganella flavida TaxID=2692175 RepID=A0A6L8K5C8_9BURK|nr:ABC transporter permease [Duganella flavida]MYM22709.1 ABC transporter permease subunit [Duganella flavida]
MSARWKGWVLPIALLVLWQWQAQRGELYASIFPSLQQIAAGAAELWNSGELAGAVHSSLRRAVLGWSSGALAGIAVGLLLALCRPVDWLFGPLFNALRQVPLFAWIPLVGLWLGRDETARLFMVQLAAFYPCLLHAYEGAAKVERRYLDVAQVLKLSARTRILKLALPAAMPSILSGVSQALAVAWIAAVASELLFATGPGLGNSMLMAEAGARMDLVLVCVALIGVLGYAMNYAASRAGAYLLRWRDSV